MERNVFDDAVWIYAGLNIPRKVDTLVKAHIVLDDWSGQRGPAHRAAFEACRRALDGQASLAAAREAFAAFAERAGILAPGLDDLVAAQPLAGSVSRPRA